VKVIFALNFFIQKGARIPWLVNFELF
jgi:hypothetical protein